MKRHRLCWKVLATCLALAPLAAAADELRNVKRGEPVPAYKLPTIDGQLVDSETLKGSIVVMVCLSAEQRSSELAAMGSRDVVAAIGQADIALVHVTADVVHKPYYERFRQERGLETPLGFDADRALYGKLGLIVFPTTIVVDREGKLSHVLSLCEADYTHVLDAFVRHTAGLLSDKELEERLKAHPPADASPKSRASAHRAAARFLREKGLISSAREELLKAREQDPANPEITLDLADLALLTGDLGEAEKLVSTVLEAEPAYRRAKQVQGIVLFRQNRLAEAEALLREALVLNPDPARVHYYLGRIYEHQGQTAKSLEHYREALRRFLDEPALPSDAPAAPK